MLDYLTSIIRTVIPTLVGCLLALLAKHGIGIDEVDSAALTGAVCSIGISAYYSAARAAEQPPTPWLAGLGRFLLGGIKHAPVYVSTRPDQLAD